MDVFVYVVWYVLLIKPGLEKQHVYIANKKTGLNAQSKFTSVPPSNPTSPADFGASLVPRNSALFRLITEFKKIAVPGPKIQPKLSIIKHLI